MCGIAGRVSKLGGLEVQSIKLMTDAIAHRGPDGSGHWQNPARTVGLGHRRLAIIDLSDGASQPMHFANRYTITFNGEIYNYVEIRQELEGKGYRFRSSSDTEVLVANYHEKREKCLDDFDGMYAFAIWDELEQSLFCARDRFGEKPFFYATHNNQFLFASEIKALWAAGLPKQVNDRMLFRYFAANSLQNPKDLSETFFSNVCKLKAAHYFYLRPEDPQVVQQRYWSIDCYDVDRSITLEDATAELRRLLDESVMRRLRSDVPVGSSLSGGLDSSIIVGLIDQQRRDSGLLQATFSARFPGFAKDEGKYMQLVIDRTLVDPHYVTPDETQLAEDWDLVVKHQEEPFNSASIYAQFCVMRLAKLRGITVLLDGQGADELLAGYHGFFFNYFYELMCRSLFQCRREVQRQSNYNPNISFDFFDALKQKAKEFVPRRITDATTRLRLIRRLQGVLHPDFTAVHIDEFVASLSSRARTLNEALHWSAFAGDLEDLLRYCDRNSMAHSREVRLPFLSHSLAEFVFRLPASFKIHDGLTKYVLREACTDILPSEIYHRLDKIGYEPPQDAWLDSPGIRHLTEVSARALIDHTYIDPRFQIPQESTSTLRWSILMANALIKP